MTRQHMPELLTKHFAGLGVSWDEFDTVEDFLNKVDECFTNKLAAARREALEEAARAVGIAMVYSGSSEAEWAVSNARNDALAAIRQLAEKEERK